MNRQKPKNILEQHIMQRVYLVWFGRYLRSSRLVRVLVLMLIVVLSRFWVSFTNIFENLQGISAEPSLISKYFVVASLHTEPIVQIFLGLGLLLALLFLFDIGKLFTRAFALPFRRG
jgi:hypothetical protein